MKIKQILIIALLLGCKPKAEFYINGKAYYTHSRCLETKHESKYGYHYGYNPMRGKFEGYFPFAVSIRPHKYTTLFGLNKYIITLIK